MPSASMHRCLQTRMRTMTHLTASMHRCKCDSECKCAHASAERVQMQGPLLVMLEIRTPTCGSLAPTAGRASAVNECWAFASSNVEAKARPMESSRRHFVRSPSRRAATAASEPVAGAGICGLDGCRSSDARCGCTRKDFEAHNRPTQRWSAGAPTVVTDASGGPRMGKRSVLKSTRPAKHNNLQAQRCRGHAGKQMGRRASSGTYQRHGCEKGAQ